MTGVLERVPKAAAVMLAILLSRGGMATSFVLVHLLAPHLTPLTRNESLVAGFFLPLAGFLGDVPVSAIKRDIGVEDSGSSIPGHGGVLVDPAKYRCLGARHAGTARGRAGHVASIRRTSARALAASPFVQGHQMTTPSREAPSCARDTPLKDSNRFPSPALAATISTDRAEAAPRRSREWPGFARSQSKRAGVARVGSLPRRCSP
jgi:hypothetical protein